MLAWLLFAVVPLVPLAVSLVNLITWRPANAYFHPPRSSALVPARNEAHTIEACVEALLREPFAEIVVCDDRSTDATPALLAGLAARDPRVRLLQGTPLPPGRVGKPHACHQLATAATGDLLVFVDADTVLLPGALGRIAAATAEADVVSLLPAQVTGGPAEALILPLLHLTYLSWLPLRLVRVLADPRVLAANGQLVAVRRDAYARFGGYGAVAHEVVDDMAFCRAAKVAGLRVAFVDGAEIAMCRMYRSGREAWEGFSKNLYEGLGARVGALIGALVLYTLCFLLPWLAWPFAPVPAAVGMGANLLQRALIARRFHHAPWVVAAHPVGVVAFLALAVNSWRWSHRGTIRWRGRIYASRRERGAS